MEPCIDARKWAEMFIDTIKSHASTVDLLNDEFVTIWFQGAINAGQESVWKTIQKNLDVTVDMDTGRVVTDESSHDKSGTIEDSPSN